MNLFLSWSGSISKDLAEILRDWIPSVIQEVEPFMSSEDIEKGVRWNMDIAKQLEESTIGIICITPEDFGLNRRDKRIEA